MKNLFLKGVLAFTLFSSTVFAQNNSRLKEVANEFTYDSNNQINFIKLKAEYSVYESEADNFLNSIVLNNSNSTVKKVKSEKDILGFTHTKYQVLYNNTPVKNAIIMLHAQNGKVVSVNGDLGQVLEPVNSVAINEQKGLQQALNKIKAEVYKWENKVEENHMKEVYNNPSFSYYPKGELVLYAVASRNQKSEMHYAYKFNIYAEKPLYRANVIVDAQTGSVLAEENLICHADVPGTANTKYSGVQSFTIDNYSPGNYRLRETGRGLGIETYNLNTSTTYANTDLTYTNTVWPATGIEQLGTDAHFGCEKTYDYYFLNHGRNSLDNAGFKLLSYINYGVNYNNAFWDGTRMTYGSGGSGGFIGLDICGHEVSHGLTENTSNLVYANESGALNESYSDIFGNSIEYYAKPLTASWILGESIGGIRNMANPNAFGDPDTYLGTNWYTGTADNGGVHTNSGVSNFWYYLLVNGGTGTNDIANSYTVNALGWTAASRIAFRALTVYYTPSTNYANARILSIQAAKDLYGNCSNEVVQVTNAWYAVGVGAAYSNSISPNFVASGTSFCSVPVNINFSNTTASGITYQWNFGDGSAVSTTTNPVHTYTANGTYSVKLKATGCLSSVDSITKVSYITINTPAIPATTSASRCGPGTVNLSATGTSQLYWYTSPTGTGTPVNIGTNYTTPSLTNTTTYYVVNTSTNTPVFAAPTSSASGTGGNYNTASAYNTFNVIQPCTLKTVVAYASTAGNRTVELRNSSNAIITSTVVNMVVGANTLTLNFALTVGTGYRLGLNAASAVNLFRTSAGGPTYPTNIGGLVDFTGTSAATAGYYYFYYNWQLQKNACVSAPIAVTASVSAGPTLTVNSPTICSGQSVNLTAGGATTYSWSSGQTTSSIAITPTASTSYTVYGTASACTNSLVSSISVNPNPTVTVNSATICNGQSTNISASGATTYSWSSGQTTASITVSPTGNTTYSVTGYSGTCSNTRTTSVVVNPNPTVTVNSPVICVGQTATITGTGATSYTFNPGNITGNPIAVSPTVSTTYTVIGANGFNCSSLAVSSVSVSLCTGVEEIPASTTPNVISIFPNPTDSYIEIYNTVTKDKTTINVYDVTGKLITTKEADFYKEYIDMSKFAKGLYFVEVMNGEKRIYKTKIIKQ
jgi:bacillolysin